MKNPESSLETGLLVLGIIIVIAMTILVGGRTMSSYEARLRRQRAQPARGNIGPERHQHISTVAAR